jgi:hypothetical protein
MSQPTFKSFGYFALSSVILLLISATLLARIPNANCHCHEKKKSSESPPCPFAQLRTLGSLLSISPPLSIAPERNVVDWATNFSLLQQIFPIIFQYTSAARAPPSL